MTYSSAWFEPGDDLHAAQLRKIDGVLDLARVGPGSRVLEIGTGWGALAIRAARRGATVTTLTISAEQRDLARCAGSPRPGSRTACRCCCRTTARRAGSYDAVVSVEMIEAVGEEYWPAYFATLDRLLAPGGRVGLQAITMPHDRMVATRHTQTWITKYVFPGGQLLSVPAVEEQRPRGRAARSPPAAGSASTTRAPCASGGTRFTAAADRVAELGFDETFRRMWEFYLAYCEAGFRAGLPRRVAVPPDPPLALPSAAGSPRSPARSARVPPRGRSGRRPESVRGGRR